MEERLMKSLTPLDLMAESIAAVSGRLDLLAADLAAAPSWKRNHAWFLDRVAERQRLLLQRDQLRAQQHALLK